MTISLLIPVCDYDIVALVQSMKVCLATIPEFLEILIGDDGSSPEFRARYKALEGGGVRLIVSEKNIGRAAIRNKLALEARSDYLLFVDADAMIPQTSEAYIRKWVESIPMARVICGGVLYHESRPGDPDIILRWKNGRRKEEKKASERNKHPYAFFSTFNVLIDKKIFEKLRFNEEIKQYGHEDTLLSYQLNKAGIEIVHIDNGLVHEGLETNRDFLNKTKLSLENLSKLFDSITDKRTFISTVKILRTYKWIRIFRLRLILVGIFIRFRERMELKIDSSDPPMWIFDLYKISMFSTFREIHHRRKIVPIIKL